MVQASKGGFGLGRAKDKCQIACGPQERARRQLRSAWTASDGLIRCGRCLSHHALLPTACLLAQFLDTRE